MAGRRHVAALGEPQCPAEGCSRPAGFATATPGVGPCLRHGGRAPGHAPQPATPAASPAPVEPKRAETVSALEPSRDPLARRLTGSLAHPDADPLGVLRIVLASARRAGYPFEEAWAVGAEAALSYMSSRRAEEWWDTLTATEQAWASAYKREGSRLAELMRDPDEREATV